METILMTMVMMFSTVAAPVFVLKMPNMMNADGSVSKWAWPAKIALAILVGASMYYFLPYALKGISIPN